ncbi:transcriptional regulator, TetR family [Thalassococcus halodurans]|uniref:Transcriptional regulator, TetR family n=1 Tax=Thalassococcus halodurans TaxID=373675 RepID=A0A1H6BGJ2_9RHOB|nr:TetR/AcrR family transcriptional regulator [Thalassococcus halodurans]SEG59467.1 transcriptional regulator, TetR family [Thalassococcus halodurans]
MARTRAKDFEEKQHQLLLVAAHVFATDGMEKASMSGIAKLAGVSKSLLYHYYPSKSELIFSIIQAHLVELEAALAEADDPSLAPRDRLQKLVKATLDAYEGADDMHKVQLNAGEALDEDQLAQVTTMNRQIVKRIADVIAEIHPELAAPSGSLLMPVTMSLFGMMNWAYLWFREDGPMTREDYARMATTLILDGVKGVA